MERIGSGIRFMLDETRRLKLPAPHFREMGEFVVAFNQAPDLARPRSQSQPQYNGTLWSEHEQLPVEEPVKNLPPEQESRLTDAVAYVREHGFITNKLYRELTGVSDRTAHRDLETLVERGRLKAVGQRAARRYVLA
jgi:predicted HTH transcriptional regulator